MNENDSKNICCFVGHRKVVEEDEIRNTLYTIIEKLIINHDVDTFLFGSKSCFNSLCYQTVSELKEKYHHIKRVYVRAEFPYIDELYKDYILQKYEDSYYPEHLVRAGKSVYIERNIEMIDQSQYCIVYYNENYKPPRRKKSIKDLTDYQPKSGTKIAYEYAVKHRKNVINVFK